MSIQFSKRLPLDKLRLQASNASNARNARNVALASLTSEFEKSEKSEKSKETELNSIAKFEFAGNHLIDFPVAISATLAVSQHLYGWPSITIGLKGEVQLACVRCAEFFNLPIESSSVWALARDEDEVTAWQKRDEDVECLTLDAAVSLEDLVVDELLLCIPMMPRCDSPLELGLTTVGQGCAGKRLDELYR